MIHVVACGATDVVNVVYVVVCIVVYVVINYIVYVANIVADIVYVVGLYSCSYCC